MWMSCTHSAVPRENPALHHIKNYYGAHRAHIRVLRPHTPTERQEQSGSHTLAICVCVCLYEGDTVNTHGSDIRRWRRPAFTHTLPTTDTHTLGSTFHALGDRETQTVFVHIIHTVHTHTSALHGRTHAHTAPSIHPSLGKVSLT